MLREVNSRLIPWIKHHSDEKFFLFVHYWDPHVPYNPPQEYREIVHHKQGDPSDLEVKEAPAGYRYVPGWGKVGEIADGTEYQGRSLSIDLYNGEIAYMDYAIGEVVATLEDEGAFGRRLGHRGRDLPLLAFDIGFIRSLRLVGTSGRTPTVGALIVMIEVVIMERS